ncbi:MAG: hypothetical protein JNL82_06665 [Myxococcales bacterium]|nr:hypothetical protein [Myxococcales bacterium]
MDLRREHAQLKQLLTSGIDLITQMPATAEHLRRVVPAFSLSLIRVDERCAPTSHYSEFFDDHSHALFASSGHVFSARSDDPAAFGNLLRNRRAVGTLVDTSPAYVAGATYQHLFKRNGIHHTLDAAIRHDGRPLGILGIFREARAPAFTRADVARVCELYPLLVHAFLAEPLPADHVECDSALIVTAADGAIEWASPAARRWLADAAFGVERAHLTDRHVLPSACRRLCAALAAVQAGAGGPQDVPSLTLPVPGGRLRLRAYGLSSRCSGEAATRCGIQLSLEMHRGLQVLRALEQAPLTPQQRRMAYAYYEGKRPREIGALLGVSPSSFKTYRKELYARLGVTSEAELRDALVALARSATFDLQRHQPRRG